MDNKKIIVQLASPERYYSKNYHDFMDCELLNGEEKIVYLALKRFLDVRSNHGNVFPTIEKIQKMLSWGNKKVIKYINSLVKKGIVKKIRQGLSKPNIYILSDHPAMWDCNSVEDMVTAAENEGRRPLTLEEHIAELERMGYKVDIKEKEPGTTTPTTAKVDPSTKNNPYPEINDNAQMQKSQDLERYTLEQIKQLFDYDIMRKEHPDQKQDIDSAMDVLHTAINTRKPTIRISGTDKPTMTVIAKLMKLDKQSILYAINKFLEQTEKIKNPASYLLTILYHAPEQYHMEKKNRENHAMGDAGHGQKTETAPGQAKIKPNGFANFHQRSYDYEELERLLLRSSGPGSDEDGL